MNHARKNMLAKIRQALQRDILSHEQQTILATRMAHHPRGILPAIQQDYLALFINKAKQAHASVETIHSLRDHTYIPSDQVSVTHCLCGIAETGTLVLLSSPDSPTTLNFLPEMHIVLLSKKNIVGYYEEAWDLIRQQQHLPRLINFITGPSCTGDLEQTLQIGVHGPKQLHILIYNEES